MIKIKYYAMISLKFMQMTNLKNFIQKKISQLVMGGVICLKKDGN